MPSVMGVGRVETSALKEFVFVHLSSHGICQ